LFFLEEDPSCRCESSTCDTSSFPSESSGGGEGGRKGWEEEKEEGSKSSWWRRSRRKLPSEEFRVLLLPRLAAFVARVGPSYMPDEVRFVV